MRMTGASRRRSASGIPLVGLALALLLPMMPCRAAPASLPCDPGQALPTSVAAIQPDGTFTLEGGILARLQGIIWPDPNEPQARSALKETLEAALAGQSIAWKAAASPDRWGITPVNLFLREPETQNEAFWLQAGLVERGLVPLWPEGLTGECLDRLTLHEEDAIARRRGYWGPRAQANRLAHLRRDPAAQTGRRLALLLTIDAIRPWRALHFINQRQPPLLGRRTRLFSIAIPNRLVSELTKGGEPLRTWAGTRAVIRVTLSSRGLARLRVDHRTHVHRLPRKIPVRNPSRL